MTAPMDPELMAINSVFRALHPLVPSQRRRVIAYVLARNTDTDMINGLPSFREVALQPVRSIQQLEAER